MKSEFDDEDDWREMMDYDISVRPLLTESAEPFEWKDICLIFYCAEGYNEMDDWMICGQLYDKRFFHLTANCCYTGWDVAGHVDATVSNSWDRLLKLGMTDEEKYRYYTEKATVPRLREIFDALRS